ncbi:hypothetical protein Taro_025250, partial [Colocasia esculenta]|nr:hypothetical protein [Colocasia esculenta]
MYWSPASPVFPVPHFRELGPESLKACRLCGLRRRCGRLVPPAVEVVAGLCVRGYETERWFLCCVVRVGYWRHELVVRSRVVASFLSDSCFATGCGS